MNTPIIISLVAATLINLIVLLWLLRTQLKLKRDYLVVKNLVQGITSDIAGLCSAAVSVDHRIVSTGEQLHGILEKISDFQKNEPSMHPYSSDIEKVRSGASINDLMQSSGLSHDEAALLIRLHGSKKA